MIDGEEQPRPVRLFYSYSHEDEDLRNHLEKHLGGLRRRGLIDSWHDRRIGVGREWADAIDENLATADIILLLISASFIDSEYIWAKEITKALELHERKVARVVPVLLKPCFWKGLPFDKLQMVPKDGHAITSWADRDEAFVEVAKAVDDAVKEIRKPHLAQEAQRKADKDRQREKQAVAQPRAERARRQVKVAARIQAEEQGTGQRHFSAEARGEAFSGEAKEFSGEASDRASENSEVRQESPRGTASSHERCRNCNGTGVIEVGRRSSYPIPGGVPVLAQCPVCRDPRRSLLTM
jgi:hypothetical protein